jgi:hypothetical protein
LSYNTEDEKIISEIFPTAPHIFSSYIDLPIEYIDTAIHTYLALNNKDDTLTQSQMLKTQDSEDFISLQISEIRGLEKLHVFDYHPITNLPPKAKLLSSIWTYQQKRHPNGDLIKHRARICVDTVNRPMVVITGILTLWLCPGQR